MAKPSIPNQDEDEDDAGDDGPKAPVAWDGVVEMAETMDWLVETMD